MVLDARAELVGPTGRRSVAVAELFREDGAGHLALNRGELVAAVEVPPADGWTAAYAKARIRDAVDFPLAGVAVALRRDGDRIAGLRVAITGSNSAPLLVPTDELVGGGWDGAAAEALAQLVRKTSNVLKTTVTGVGYRRRVLLALAPRTVDALWQGS